MQFLPSTWRDYTGGGNPENIDAAAEVAAQYLCVGGRDMGGAAGWWAGIMSYNNSVDYARKVFGQADNDARAAYQALTVTPPPVENLFQRRVAVPISMVGAGNTIRSKVCWLRWTGVRPPVVCSLCPPLPSAVRGDGAVHDPDADRVLERFASRTPAPVLEGCLGDGRHAGPAKEFADGEEGRQGSMAEFVAWRGRESPGWHGGIPALRSARQIAGQSISRARA
jgi:hypothetical protein